MDNFELRVWLELWKDEQEKVLTIRSTYSKSQLEITILKELLQKMTEKEARNELSAMEKPVLPKLKQQIVDSERYFEKMEKEYQGRQVELMLIQEKIKIIEEKIGSDTMLAQEKEGLLKNIFLSRK